MSDNNLSSSPVNASADGASVVPVAEAVASAPVKPRIGPYRRHLLLCTGPRCTPNGESESLFDSLGAMLKEAGLTTGELRVKRTRTSCFAACKGGPILCVQPDGTWYYNVTPDNMKRIIDEHLLGGKPVESLVFHQGPVVAVDAAV
ncbi:MAG: NAD(P)H-dependent oxidoreductase subunit E [Lautropia sp.]|nr:NAD(P)H-dependent oxidoreductase subunit E [Lautropia sp.]